MAGLVLAASDPARLHVPVAEQHGALADERAVPHDGWAAERIAPALYIDAETVRGHWRRKTVGISRLERLACV